MLRKFLFTLLLTTNFLLAAKAQVTFILKPNPGVDTAQALFLAHNFNRWQAGDPNFQFKGGILRTKLSRRNLQYKICGLSWDVVEASADGHPVQNRQGYYHDGDTIYLQIAGFEQKGDHPPKGVALLKSNKQLLYKGEQRKIWVYLPKNYHSTKDKYPVLYLQDAQNLFLGLEGSPDKWQVAQTLDSLKLNLIVVAINHGGIKRIDELSPFLNEKHGGGEGDAYLDFVVGQVKPWVDQNYRSLASREHTYIGGSSLGGLISMYALLKYPDTFGGGLVFSPSYWFNPEVLEMARNFPPKKRTFVYQVVGNQEGSMPEAFMRDLRKSEALLDSVPAIWTHHSEIIEGAKHNEHFWRREFPKALTWFFENSPLKDLKND